MAKEARRCRFRLSRSFSRVRLFWERLAWRTKNLFSNARKKARCLGHLDVRAFSSMLLVFVLHVPPEKVDPIGTISDLCHRAWPTKDQPPSHSHPQWETLCSVTPAKCHVGQGLSLVGRFYLKETIPPGQLLYASDVYTETVTRKKPTCCFNWLTSNTSKVFLFDLLLCGRSFNWARADSKSHDSCSISWKNSRDFSGWDCDWQYSK